ncbi:hypothetical protein EXIGLDRAFT_760868 [Exidia glandulosa HHB12029]|uniref:F-box domain-containing protein n=1 Tax=Exidia glandulosa HHB12029 TaxID=1314781 RepID=A0A165NXZ6_EXIGL|nr:hypothetical protein EXIGLDRAFT_760868 [Exidia glandulosa HHB12029]
MTQIPSELLIYVLNLACAEDIYDIVQKFRLAQVYVYWRAVALDHPTFWARIRIKTSKDAILLPSALAHSVGATLDVEIIWKHCSHLATILPDAEQHAVVAALLAPAQRLRLGRFCFQYSYAMQGSLIPLLGAGLDFPALTNLEIQGVYGAQGSLQLRLGASSVRNLALSHVNVASWDTLIIPSLKRLYMKTPLGRETVWLLTTILSRCTVLRELEWNNPTPTHVPLDVLVQHSGSLARQLHILRLGVDVGPYDVLRFINLHRAPLDPIHDITVGVWTGHQIGGEMLQLLPEVLRGTSSLLDLRVDTDETIVIRDESGRIRRMVIWNPNHAWGISELWVTLATHYAVDKSLQSLRMRTLDWAGFTDGFSKRSPISLTVGHISLCGDLEYDTIKDETWGSDTRPPSRPPGILNIPSLGRLVLSLDGDTVGNPESIVSVINRVRKILQLIDCDSDASGRVEVCIADAGLPRGEELPTRETLLHGFSGKWDLCPHCIGS